MGRTSLLSGTAAVLFILACSWYPSAAQVSFPGKCASLPVVSPFNLNRYLGLWYEIEKYPAKFESGGKCVFAQYSLNPNGTVQVRNGRILNDTSGEYDQIIGNARLEDPSRNEAKLVVNFPTSPSPSPDANYWVLTTDYDYFAVVWSCTEVGDNNLQFLWYLSRAINPDDDERANVRVFMRQQGLDTTHLVTTDQSRCPNPNAIL